MNRLVISFSSHSKICTLKKKQQRPDSNLLKNESFNKSALWIILDIFLSIYLTFISAWFYLLCDGSILCR